MTKILPEVNLPFSLRIIYFYKVKSCEIILFPPCLKAEKYDYRTILLNKLSKIRTKKE